MERSVCHWEAADEPIDHIVLDPFISPYGIQNVLPVALSQKESGISLPEQLKTLELTLIQQALETHRGHQQRSADSLGLSYHQMRALLRKYKAELKPD